MAISNKSIIIENPTYPVSEFVERYFVENNLSVIRWAIVSVVNNKFVISASIEESEK